MSVKLYYNLLSQPSRALYIFMKKCNIPFESKIVELRKGEQYKPEFLKVNPFSKVPVLDNNGFVLTESIAILRYLAREFNVPDNWYPSESKAQAKVDEYLEWQHLNTRLHCAMFVQTAVLLPSIKGVPPNPKEVEEFKGRMIDCLDKIENIWLKDKTYMASEKISVADIIAACEIEQPRMAGYDPREGRPRLSSWLDRVKEETSPYYEEANVIINKIANKSKESAVKSKI